MKGNKIRFFYEKYKHAIPLLIYGIIYLTWFAYLERKVTKDYWVIHMALDDRIPFCEAFVIPYFLWFVYVSAIVVYLFFKDKDDYYRACIFLFTGMTIFPPCFLTAITCVRRRCQGTTSLSGSYPCFTAPIRRPIYGPAFMYIIRWPLILPL